MPRNLICRCQSSQIAAIGLGVGLLSSALTAKYRDLTHLGGFLIKLWLYVTLIIYPKSLTELSRQAGTTVGVEFCYELLLDGYESHYEEIAQ